MEIQNPRPRLRNPIACEQCKIKKARCNPSEVEGKCQKCLKSGTRCVPSERHPRPRQVQRISKTSGRVSELEKKIDGILGSIENRNTLTRTENVKSPYLAETSLGPDEEERAEVLIDIHKHLFPDGARPDDRSDNELEQEETQHSSPDMDHSMPTPASSTNQNLSQTTSQSILDSKECGRLVFCFKEMLPYFPFIIIPPESNPQSLSQEKPFLFLAMITAASFTHQPRLQTTLDTQFRQSLSTKVIMGGQKNLEIVQGLLVYISWYPYHLNPRNAQTFQFLQIAISMCNDLGLDHPSQNPGQSSSEHRRAYLSCYYLSTSFSTMFKKPNNINYTQYTESCCETFTANPEYPTDTLLPWLINICHSTALFAKSPLTTCIPYEVYKGYLEHHSFNSTSPTQPPHPPQPPHPKTKELTTLTLNFIPLFQTSLLGPIPTPKTPPSTILQNLKPSLKHSIQYIETLLSLPPKSYRSFTIIQWSQLITTIVILMKLSFPLPNLPDLLSKDTWDTEVARREGRLGIYLESLCWRMSCLGGVRFGAGGEREDGSRDVGSRGQHQNQFLMMGVVLEFVKSSFDRRIEKINATCSSNLKRAKNTREESEIERNPETGKGTEANEQSIFLSKGPTKCPMLNGTFRALATTDSSTSTTWSSSTTIPSTNPYDPTNTEHGHRNGEVEGEYSVIDNFDGFEWGGSSLDDFTLWDNMPETDWSLGGIADDMVDI